MSVNTRNSEREGRKPQKIAETSHLEAEAGRERVWSKSGLHRESLLQKQNTSKWINNSRDTLKQTPCWEKWSIHEGSISYCGWLITLAAWVWNPEACGQLEEELQTAYTQVLPHTSTCQNCSIIKIRKIKTGRSGHSCSAFVMMRTCNSSELLVPKPQTLRFPVSKGTFWLTQTKLRLSWPLNVKGIMSKFTDFTHERKRCGFICSLISPVEGTVGRKATLADLVGRHGVDLSEKQQEGAWTPDDGGCPYESPMSYHWLAS